MIKMTCDFLKFFEITCCSHSEDGVTVSVDRKSDEVVKFFLIDREMKNKEYVKKRQEISNGEICDLVISYEKKRINEITFCLVELKGSKINHAIDQVSKVFDSLITKECCHHPVKWKCYICSHGSSPIKYDTSHEKKLKDRFQMGRYKISKNRKTDPFSNFLRL
jgi:hypothetical protein